MMTQRQQAESLAEQLIAAGITPENVTSHPAYDGRFLSYAMDDNGEPVLGQRACSLHSDKQDGWLLWDDHGAHSETITYRDGGWHVA